MRKFVFSVIFLLLFFASGCLVEGILPSGSASLNPDFTQHINAFGVNLLKALWEEREENLFISPASIELALAMAANGARGTTQSEMLQALELLSFDMEEVNQQNANLVKICNRTNSKVTLSVANSLWAREGVPFYENYLQTVQQFYQAEAHSVDFADPQTINLINQWVREKTHGKITRIIDRLSDLDVLVLLNAIYFKAKWKYTFDAENTQLLPFYSAQGESRELPTMWQEGSFDYFENQTLQAIRLPYADERFSMYIFLPRAQDGLPNLLEGLNASLLEGWIQSMEKREGEIYLPRFKLSFERSLNATLQELGMERAFDPQNADFGGMLPIPPNAFLSEVKHKSILEVNEEGTTAAAVTSVIIGITALPPEERFLMRVDHPFLLAIRDEESGLILFLGAVENPEAL
jgi:serpin B